MIANLIITEQPWHFEGYRILEIRSTLSGDFIRIIVDQDGKMKVISAKETKRTRKDN